MIINSLWSLTELVWASYGWFNIWNVNVGSHKIVSNDCFNYQGSYQLKYKMVIHWDIQLSNIDKFINSTFFQNEFGYTKPSNEASIYLFVSVYLQLEFEVGSQFNQRINALNWHCDIKHAITHHILAQGYRLILTNTTKISI